MKQLQAKVKSQKKITKDYYLLTLESSSIARESQPGQFVLLLPQAKDVFLRRPFTLHQTRRDDFQILYKIVGPATKAMSFYEQGDKLDIIGPLGKGFDFFPEKKVAILVGGGSGVAGLFFLAERINFFSPESEIKVLFGAKTKNELIPFQDFSRLGIKVQTATDDGSFGYKGLISELLDKELSGCVEKSAVIYACGPRPMLKKVAELSRRCACPCQISWEEIMACGVGSCGGCAVKTKDKKYKRICVDGPVFAAREIEWE